MSGGHLVLAYHGCDVTTRDALVSGHMQHLTPSENDYDWLGPGVYFFEGDARRALQFSRAAASQPSKRYTRNPIANPSLVGAVLRIGHWLDMTTQAGLEEFKEAHTVLSSSADEELPRNVRADASDNDVILRKLDRLVFKALHAQLESSGRRPYDAVRAAFQQGADLIESSAFKARSHIQIALRNPECVEGWFIVPDDDPVLDESMLAAAKAELALARSTLVQGKRRVGASARLST